MYPKNPEKIVLKNEYYPLGLREIDIWNYYQKYRDSICEQALHREIIIFLSVDGIIVLRKSREGSFIKLTRSNYDKIISGRTLSLHATMKKREDVAIVDIDCNNFDLAKQATLDCYDKLVNFKLIKDIQIRFTGKTSFHIFCRMDKKYNIDSIRLVIEKYLKSFKELSKYTFLKSRTSTRPNIDLFRNVYRAGFIMLNSLSVIGLRCMELDPASVESFNKTDAII